MSDNLVISSGEEWTFDKIEAITEEIEKIAVEKYGLDVYPNQLEMITSEQMLDAYCSVGLPIYYSHWSFGESFVRQQEAYRRGHMGLAYEIVINSNPCIAYLMEENTMLMQTLVIAHASFGHNFFFKNNYLFKQWTDAEGIVDYLLFAKRYIRQCEERYGIDEVESILDAAHALSRYGVDKYKRPSKLSAAQEEAQRKERDEYVQTQLNDLWRTVPSRPLYEEGELPSKATHSKDQFPSEPQENILYFIEKHAPRLESWKREIIRIVRKISQYFYPQMQTKVMNEGCATYFHYKIIHDLYERGFLDEGAMLEFYSSHSNVVFQPDFDSKYYSQINPYALGFAMAKDIERICMDPTDEDREWFKGQDWVGCGDYVAVIKNAFINYKDESFIQQFLSPKVIRDFKLFAIHDDEEDPQLEVDAIHNKQGYKTVRNALAAQHNIGYHIPDIQVTNVDRWGTRALTLKHYMVNRRPLDTTSAIDTLEQLVKLWGYDVVLDSVDDQGKKCATYVSTVENDEIETLIDVYEDDGE